MTNRPQTVVSGLKSGALPRPAKTGNANLDFAAISAWVDTNSRCYILRGHWDAQKALDYAARKGVTAEKIEHCYGGIAGKPWSRGTVRRFAVIGGTIQPVQC